MNVRLPTYPVTQLKLPPSTGFIATLLGGLIFTIGSPAVGHWSDKVGRTQIMTRAALLFLLTAFPALLATLAPTVIILILIVCWLSLLKTASSGVLPSSMAKLFPARTRGTGVASSYDISVPIFGGFALFFVALLIQLTGTPRALI